MVGPEQPNASKLHKLRAKEYRDRYESMRSLEWKVIFQVYVGYTALAAVFYRLIDQFNHHGAFRIVAMTATLAFCVAAQYLYFRIQERLIVFNETYEWHMARANPTPHEDLPKGLGTDSLGHKYFWTYDMQVFLGSLTMLSLLAYEAVIGHKMPENLSLFFWTFAPFCLISLTTSAIMLLRLRRIRSNIRKTVNESVKAEGDALRAATRQ